MTARPPAKPRPPHPEPSAAARAEAARREEALIHLKQVKEDLGYIPGDVKEEIAEDLGVHEEHLSRMLRRYCRYGEIAIRPGSTKKKCLPDEWKAQVAYFHYRGVASKAWEALRKTGDLPLGMSLKAFQRRVNEWDPAIRACAKGGYRAMVKHQFFNIEHIPYKGYAYGSDHTKLPIQVIPKRGTKPVFPWLTTLIDLKTRVVLAYKLTIHDPTAEDSVDVFVEGVYGWFTPDGMFVGGKPHFLRTDRGGDYISKLLSKNLFDLAVGRQFTEPYSSWQNGRTEALNGTIDEDFAPTVPGFHPGGEDEYTRRVFKTPIPTTSLLSLETLDRRIGDWFGDYNNRVHSKLHGLTPLEAWAADFHVVEKAEHATIVNAMTPREIRSLQNVGIECRKKFYSHPTLGILRKRNVQQVEVRYHEHDLNRIEVVVDGVHEGTAFRTEVQPDHQRLGTLSIRAAQRRLAERLMRQADYERALAERERLLEEDADESELPALPPLPDDEDDDALTEDETAAVEGAGTTAVDWEKGLNRGLAGGTNLYKESLNDEHLVDGVTDEEHAFPGLMCTLDPNGATR